MSFDRSMARCSFCGRHSSEVRHMIAGPGAAYICEDCLHLCQTILNDPTPFSAQALELASRPPVVAAAPTFTGTNREAAQKQEGPLRIRNIEIEQKQQGMTFILHQLLYYPSHFELQYLWLRPPFIAGFAFVPRILFLLKDDTGQTWSGERGGMLLARSDLTRDDLETVYQGNARFRPLPAPEARYLTIQAADPLSLFDNEPTKPWVIDITL